MEVSTPRTPRRRSTRLRVEIPMGVTSLDRMRPFADRCVALVVSAQGCSFRSANPLPLETPILLSDLPGGRSVTARVANCLPVGSDGKAFLIGAALYTHGNVWGIANPPDDWNVPEPGAPAPSPIPTQVAASAPKLKVSRSVWPYSLFRRSSEIHPGRK